MEPDELLLSTRSAGPDDSHRHPAVAAAAASPGARGYLAVGSVLYACRSDCTPVLSAERGAAEVAAPDCDGLLSDRWRSLHLGIGGISLHPEPRVALPCSELTATAGDHYAVWFAFSFGYRVFRVYGQWFGDRRNQFALPAPQREVRDIARLWLAGDGVSDPSRGLPEGGLLEPVLRLHHRGAQFSTPSGA